MRSEERNVVSTAGGQDSTYSWRKMEVAAQDRGGWRQVVCGLYVPPHDSDKA